MKSDQSKTKSQLIEELNSIREREDNLRRLYENTPLGYQSLDIKGRFITVNKAWLELLGYTREEVIGKWFSDFLAPGYVEHFKDDFPRFKEKGEISGVQFKMVTKKGEHIYVEFNGRIGYDSEGGFKQTHCILHDITRRRKSEELLAEQEKRYRTLAEAAQDAIFIIDSDDKIEFVNTFAAEQFGKRPEELIGKSRDILFSLEDAENQYKSLQKVFTSGERLTAESKVQYGMREVWLNTQLVPLIDTDGKTKAVLGISRDITERKLIEENLRQYEHIVSTSTDMLALLDTKFKYLAVNKSYVEAFNKTPDEFIGQTVSGVFGEEFFTSVIKPNADRCLDGEEVNYQDWFDFPAYGRHYMDITYCPFYSEDTILGFVVNGRNITKQKQAEANLQIAKEFSEQLIDTASTIILTLDDKANITLFNKFAGELTGYKREEVLGKNWFGTFIPDRDRVVIPQVFKDVLEEMPSSSYHENPIMCKDGSERLIAWNNTVLKDDNAKIFGVLSMGYDITERKRVEEKLQKSEERYRLLFDYAPDAYFISDLKGKTIDVNVALENLLGIDKTKIVGKNFINLGLLHKAHLPNAIKLLDKSAKGQKTEPEEFTFFNKDGSKIEAGVKMHRVKIGDKSHLLGIVRDITKRKKAEEEREKAFLEAQRANKVKDLFMANMSHEIRTPLNSILGFSEIIKESFKDHVDEEKSEYFKIVHNSGQRLIRTVHGILDISQIEADTVPYNPDIADLASIVELVFKEFKPMAATRKLKLTYDCQIDDGTVMVDQPSIEKAITNLVDNAIKYTEEGQIEIKLKDQKGKYILSIGDTGIGIGEDYIDHIYDAFSQESTGYTKTYQGLGLGLSIAKSCMDMNSIPIDVKSEQGIGTTFTLTFEAFSERRLIPRLDKEAPKIIESPVKTLQKSTILIVEDDENNRKTLEVILKKNYETPFAISVDEAKKQLDKHKVELVLLDLSLEGDKNGLDLVAYMKTKKKLKEIPIIAVTAYAFDSDRDNVLNAGCNDYMSKPIDIKKLQDMIDQYV
ncbi:MAG: PAS domain S-box protein [Candidatus Marinimicrobia bacterium]|nr:PAS domain S-box protein [Candidatus Neomarinimicrobiota bacterium]